MDAATRRWGGPAGLVALAVLLVLAWWSWPEPPVVAARAPVVPRPASVTAPPRVAPDEVPVRAAGATPEEIRALSEAAVAEGASLSEGLDLPPPAITDAQVAMPERPPPVTEEELLDQKVDGIGTIDRTLDRLEEDLAAADAAGDEALAHRLRLRIERLEQTRAERVAEIEGALEGEVP